MPETKTREPIDDKLILLLNLSYASFHEAGHTLLCLLNFSRVEVVKIGIVSGLTDIQYGETTYESVFEHSKFSNSLLFNFNIHSEIAILYAGQESERHLFKECSGSNKFPFFLKNGSHFDKKQAHQLIKRYINVSAGLERAAFKKAAIKETYNTIHENWKDVQLIAHALFKSKRLFYKNLKKLLTTKSKNKEFWKNQFRAIDKIFREKEKIDAGELQVILGIT